ncbi:DEAD/DEAH box helicase [Croceicoccus marinus]|uniref:DEAD/DEAH box helicase family protein n=1 Tax=Croceicoccus marinus TaxID=450378 RepID=A0A7G6VU12_9SPHN|nr:DEAD/DEAH box helicase [Croceicoccus marinus]QNE05227.1 DEAD/DEAH box helicase family protein [Croceicoccus marinus]
MVTTKFIATQNEEGGETIALLREKPGGLFRRASNEIVPVSEWPRAAPEAGQAALALTRALDNDGQISEEAEGIVLPPQIVARLDEADAFALGLPPATSITLQLNSGGSLAEGTIKVDTKWVRRGGLPVRADIAGARLREGGRVGRIPEPIYSAFQAALAVNAADDPDQRRAAFAELRSTLGDDIGTGIEADGFLERVRIAYAANFSLNAKTDHGRFDFDPVLFSRNVSESAEGDLVDEEEASLLTPQDNQHFQRRFRGQDGGRRSYLLSDGTLLFLDPMLGKALDIVRAKQVGTSQEKREFLRSPQRILREELKLDAAGDDEAADRLFIETQQFSERVSGIEVWQKPVLPWIKPKPNSWLPEGFGLRIGDPPDARHVELAPGEAETIASEVETAIDAGKETIAWRDESIPATPATLQAARAIADFEREIADEVEGSASDRIERESVDIFFLQVGENFEQLDYARLPRPDAEVQDFDAPGLPKGLKSEPKPHQVQAFAWFAEAWERRMPGVLLADDMGLGKTFQALMFLLWLRSKTPHPKPVLIVAPTGLLRNWQAELSQHIEADLMGPVVEAFGANLRNFRLETGSDIRGGTSRLDVSEWNDAGIVLTTYETMRDYHMSFARIPFAAIVYDEIQKLKNPASQMTRAAKALNGTIQIAMTGTPVENRLQDLWSIADTVYPGFLGSSREFESSFPANVLERLGDLQHRLIERDKELPPFMLRRMKDEILTGLPEKKARKYPVEMPAAQAQAYDLVLARARALRESGEQGAMLKVLHMLRGTSLHPSPPRGISNIDEYIGQSARLKKTFEILEEVQQCGEKALLFCEDLEMQAFLAMAIQERFALERRPMCISGKVAGHKRQEMVTAFQSSPAAFDVLILSPKAGGVGLTITAANNVIHLSRWWNPAVEDQATDRAYRIGQTRPVTIHIPMAVHPDDAIGPSSFDQRLDALMERKRSLSRGLLMPPESDRDVEDLLSDVLDGRPAENGDHDSAFANAEQAAADKDNDRSINSRQSEPLVPSVATPEIEEAPGDEEDIRSFGPKGENTTSAANHDPAAERAAEQSSEEAARSQTQSDTGEAASSNPEPKERRPILSVRTPVESAEARVSVVQRVVFEQYGQRDWTIFEQYARDARIERLEIQDPYCCADEQARGRLINFIGRFEQLASEIAAVQIVTFDADSVQTRDPESTRDQRQDLEGRWNRMLASVPLHLAQKSRRSGGDLHDRFVRAKLDNGDTVIWDLGRGIDGVMNARWSCVVNAYREGAAGRDASFH